jgi:DNA-directed RNA polymerase subunit RPC12/RpoP
MPFRNAYRCTRCGHEWSYVWPDQRNDDCPNCGARRMAPKKSDKVELSKRETIAMLNDAFRRSFAGGKVVMTCGVDELPDMVKAEALCAVAAYRTFTDDNDPHGEHDFGNFELCGRKFFWKIDYYDRDVRNGSDDPSDAERTTRVLTVMLASEY